MKLIEIQKALKKAGARVFTTDEFRRYASLSLSATRQFLQRYTDLGVFWQVRRGLYAFCDPAPHPWVVANKLYRPSYISFETALSHYGMIPETVYGVASVTTRLTRRFEAGGMLFLFHAIKPKAYTGYQPLVLHGDTVLIAEREKALADYLYFVHLGKKQLNERLNCKAICKKILEDHLALFGRKQLINWSRHVIAGHS